MSKEFLFDKYGNEIVKLEVKYNDKLQSICMNCFKIGGVKWNDIDNGSFLTLTINKKDLIDQLVENEVKFDFDEDDNGETVKQVIVDNEKYIDIEYFARTKADLEAKLAEKEKERHEEWKTGKEWKWEWQKVNYKLEKANQDKISFAVEKLTEIRDYVKNCWSLDTTEGKVRLDIAKKIRLKIEELKGNENE